MSYLLCYIFMRCLVWDTVGCIGAYACTCLVEQSRHGLISCLCAQPVEVEPATELQPGGGDAIVYSRRAVPTTFDGYIVFIRTLCGGTVCLSL